MLSCKKKVDINDVELLINHIVEQYDFSEDDALQIICYLYSLKKLDRFQEIIKNFNRDITLQENIFDLFLQQYHHIVSVLEYNKTVGFISNDHGTSLERYQFFIQSLASCTCNCVLVVCKTDFQIIKKLDKLNTVDLFFIPSDYKKYLDFIDIAICQMGMAKQLPSKTISIGPPWPQQFSLETCKIMAPYFDYIMCLGAKVNDDVGLSTLNYKIPSLTCLPNRDSASMISLLDPKLVEFSQESKNLKIHKKISFVFVALSYLTPGYIKSAIVLIRKILCKYPDYIYSIRIFPRDYDANKRHVDSILSVVDEYNIEIATGSYIKDFSTTAIAIFFLGDSESRTATMYPLATERMPIIFRDSKRQSDIANTLPPSFQSTSPAAIISRIGEHAKYMDHDRTLIKEYKNRYCNALNFEAAEKSFQRFITSILKDEVPDHITTIKFRKSNDLIESLKWLKVDEKSIANVILLKSIIHHTLPISCLAEENAMNSLKLLVRQFDDILPAMYKHKLANICLVLSRKLKHLKNNPESIFWLNYALKLSQKDKTLAGIGVRKLILNEKIALQRNGVKKKILKMYYSSIL